MVKRKLISSGFIYTLGNILIQGLGFITLPIFTRITSQTVFGQFGLYNSWITMISIFIGLQLVGSLAVGKVRFQERFDEYVLTVLTVSNVAFLIFFGLTWVFRGYLSKQIYFSESYLLMMVTHSYLNYLAGFLSTYFIQVHKILMSFVCSLCSALGSVFFSILLVYQLEDDFFARVMGALIPVVLVAVITLIYFYQKKRAWYQKEYARFALAISLPLIFHHLGHNLLNQFDRIMIGKMMSVIDVGIYSFGYNLGMIMHVVLISLNTVWAPWYFEAKKQQNPSLPQYIRHYLSVGLFLTLGYLTIFPDLAWFMGGEKYSVSIQFIAWIILSYFFVFLYTFPVNIQFYHENTKLIPLGTLMAGGINIVLNLVLIPVLGIYGAAFATVLSYVSLLVVHHGISRFLYRYEDVGAQSYLILSGVAFGYALLMNFLVCQWVIRWVCGMCVLVVYGYYYRDEIRSMVKKVRR